MKDVFWTMTFFCFGIWMILHSAKAVRTGVFHGWYNHTYKCYYIHRNESPFHFWFDTLFFALMGSCFIGLSGYRPWCQNWIFICIANWFHLSTVNPPSPWHTGISVQRRQLCCRYTVCDARYLNGSEERTFLYKACSQITVKPLIDKWVKPDEQPMKQNFTNVTKSGLLIGSWGQ